MQHIQSQPQGGWCTTLKLVLTRGRCCQVSHRKLHAQQGLDSAGLQAQTGLQVAQPDVLIVRCVSSWHASQPVAPAQGLAAFSNAAAAQSRRARGLPGQSQAAQHEARHRME